MFEADMEHEINYIKDEVHKKIDKARTWVLLPHNCDEIIGTCKMNPCIHCNSRLYWTLPVEGPACLLLIDAKYEPKKNVYPPQAGFNPTH